MKKEQQKFLSWRSWPAFQWKKWLPEYSHQMQTDLRKAVRVNSTVDRFKTVQGHKNTPTQKHTPQTPTHLDIHLFTSIHPHPLSTQTPTTTQLHAYPHSSTKTFTTAHLCTNTPLIHTPTTTKTHTPLQPPPQRHRQRTQQWRA